MLNKKPAVKKYFTRIGKYKARDIQTPVEILDFEKKI